MTALVVEVAAVACLGGFKANAAPTDLPAHGF
jgi:hypothetical protein